MDEMEELDKKRSDRTPPKNIPLGPCPRCGSKNLKKRGGHVTCKSCDLELSAATVFEVARLWNMPEKNRLSYIYRCLDQFGNAYVGDFTADVLGGMEAAKARLEKETGIPLTAKRSDSGDIILSTDQARARAQRAAAAT